MKRIYIISDGTGQSAINLMRAVLLQFSSGDIKFTVYSKVDNEPKLKVILEYARIDGAFVAFTIVRRQLRDFVHKFTHDHDIMHYDILGTPLEKLSDYLGEPPRENPGELRKVNDAYFRRIDAIEYTITHDDGKSVEAIREADLVVLGLSRTSKTPTSFFLAQLGYRVVNIPLVPEVPLPKELWDIDQSKIVCLVMDPEVLQKVRSARLRHYRTTSKYTDIMKIFEEVEFVHELTRRNRQWHIVDTTNKSIEETSREIISAVYGRDLEF